MLWARVDYKEMVRKKSSFLNCFEKKHLLTALLLLFDLFAAHLLIRRSMNEWKSKSAMRLLLFYYSFISFSRRVKTNFIGTISHLSIRLFLATCWLNTEMTSWYHGFVYSLNVRYYVFNCEYLQSDDWTSYLCKKAKRAKRAMSRLKKQVCEKGKSG